MMAYKILISVLKIDQIDQMTKMTENLSLPIIATLHLPQLKVQGLTTIESKKNVN